MNMGFLSFKKAKNISPVKFMHEKLVNPQKKIESSQFFKENPHMLEFINVNHLFVTLWIREIQVKSWKGTMIMGVTNKRGL